MKHGKKNTKVLSLVILAVVVAALFAAQLTRVERSVSAYCKVYEEENAKLANADGDTYSTRFFDHRSSDPGDFAAALKELERVSPDDIHSDIKTLRQIFETIDEDPSQALSASLGGIGPESNIEIWTEENCSSNS